MDVPRGRVRGRLPGNVMHAVVCVKVGVDPESVEVDPRTGLVRVERLAHAVDPGSAAALEIALGVGADVTVVGAGLGAAVSPALRRGLASGAAAAVLVDGDASAYEPVAVARALAEFCAGADLVLCGARSADEGSGVVAPALAALLGAAFVDNVDRLDVHDGALRVRQRRPGGATAVLSVTGRVVCGVHPEAPRLREPALRAVLRARDAAVTRRPLSGATSAEVAAGPARPRPRPVVAPASKDPWARTWELVSAALPAREGRVVTGDADVLAAALLGFLDARGLR